MAKQEATTACVLIAAFAVWSNGCGQAGEANARSSGGAGGSATGGVPGSGGSATSGTSGSGGVATGGSSGSGGALRNIYVDQIRTSPGVCLPRALIADSTGADAGRVPCQIVELSFRVAGCLCDTARGREPVDAAVEEAVRKQAASTGLCAGDGPICASACACEIRQLSGAELDSCQNDEPVEESLYGFCYVDPEIGLGNPALVADCPELQRRRLRFVGADTPAPDAAAFIACTGGTL